MFGVSSHYPRLPKRKPHSSSVRRSAKSSWSHEATGWPRLDRDDRCTDNLSQELYESDSGRQEVLGESGRKLRG
jgi:hypothetical protein